MTICHTISNHMYIFRAGWNTVFIDDEAVSKCKNKFFILKRMKDIKYAATLNSAYNSTEMRLEVCLGRAAQVERDGEYQVWFSEDLNLLEKIIASAKFYQRSAIIPITHETDVAVSFGEVSFILTSGKKFDPDDFFL